MSKMGIRKTIRRAPKKNAGEEQPDTQLSRTMQITPEVVFDSPIAENKAYLECSGPDVPFARVVLDKKNFSIGRDDSCDLVLPVTNVSRVHARITENSEQYVVEDLDSTNGTLVNGVKVSRCTLHSQDRIQVGNSCLTFIQQKRRSH